MHLGGDLPSKKVKIDDSVHLGIFRINKKGFPEIKGKAVSRAKVDRMRKAGIKEVEYDTACSVKHRKNMAQKLFKRYGMYKSPTAVARLEKVRAPVVVIGKTRTYFSKRGGFF